MNHSVAAGLEFELISAVRGKVLYSEGPPVWHLLLLLGVVLGDPLLASRGTDSAKAASSAHRVLLLELRTVMEFGHMGYHCRKLGYPRG